MLSLYFSMRARVRSKSSSVSPGKPQMISVAMVTPGTLFGLDGWVGGWVEIEERSLPLSRRESRKLCLLLWSLQGLCLDWMGGWVGGWVRSFFGEGDTLPRVLLDSILTFRVKSQRRGQIPPQYTLYSLLPALDCCPLEQARGGRRRRWGGRGSGRCLPAVLGVGG